MGVACRNLDFIRWVRSCCPGQAEFKALVPANFSGWPSKNAIVMLWYEFWELYWRVCQNLLSSSNLPPTFFDFHWLSCGRSAASDHCRGPGLAGLSLAHCNMSTSGRRLVDLHLYTWLPLSTVWEWASPTKVRATCFANGCRWWFPGGLHCWWGLCLHLQFGTERQAEALVWFIWEYAFCKFFTVIPHTSPALASYDSHISHISTSILHVWQFATTETVEASPTRRCTFSSSQTAGGEGPCESGFSETCMEGCTGSIPTHLFSGLAICGKRCGMAVCCFCLAIVLCISSFFFVWLINCHLGWHFPYQCCGYLLGRLADIDTCHL